MYLVVMNFEEELLDKITSFEIEDVVYVHVYDEVFQYTDRNIEKIVCRGNIGNEEFRSFLKRLDGFKNFRNVLVSPEDFVANYRTHKVGSRLNLHQMMELLDQMEGDFLTKEDEVLFQLNSVSIQPYIVGDAKIIFKTEDLRAHNLTDIDSLELHVHGWTNNEKFSFDCVLEKSPDSEYEIEDLCEYEVHPRDKLALIQEYLSNINSSVSRNARNPWEFKG